MTAASLHGLETFWKDSQQNQQTKRGIGSSLGTQAQTPLQMEFRVPSTDEKGQPGSVSDGVTLPRSTVPPQGAFATKMCLPLSAVQLRQAPPG